MLAGATPVLAGCMGFLPAGGERAQSATPLLSDPTPLAKCQVAANSSSPLVTEWPASEKAHLQSMASSRIVAVEYSGCELRIVDSCPLSGGYLWSRTTLATDMVEIQNADDLYAKLPIGAVGLEGELARSGRLAVRSTVSGQLHARPIDPTELTNTGCHQATHFVSAISVGAFQLLSGSEDSGTGSVSVGPAGAGVRSSRREVVLREAGVRESCADSTEHAPHTQCGSPIQVFLAPLPDRDRAAPVLATAGAPDPNRGAAVHIRFPEPDDEDEVWTLRAPGGRVLCTLPCDQWVGPVSGDYLQREPRKGQTQIVLPLPQSFPHPVGSRVTAEFQAERGNPTLARWALWGAIPTGIMGAGLTTWGFIQAFRTCEDASGRDGCFPPAGFLIPTGIVFMAMGGVGIWWNAYSREERFNTYESIPSRGSVQGSVRVRFTGDGLAGTF